MKIKIEADLSLNEKETLQAVSKAIIKKEVIELMQAFPAGQHFKMENELGTIILTKL